MTHLFIPLNQMYEIMLRCWDRDPNLRPCFSTVSDVLEKQLESSVRRLYVDLSDAFSKQVGASKTVHLSSPDYLNMMNSSNYVNLRKSMEGNRSAKH